MITTLKFACVVSIVALCAGCASRVSSPVAPAPTTQHSDASIERFEAELHKCAAMQPPPPHKFRLVEYTQCWNDAETRAVKAEGVDPDDLMLTEQSYRVLIASKQDSGKLTAAEATYLLAKNNTETNAERDRRLEAKLQARRALNPPLPAVTNIYVPSPAQVSQTSTVQTQGNVIYLPKDTRWGDLGNALGNVLAKGVNR
jgi:hypothetical protein